MKRIGNLYEQIISLENLRLADQKARRGKLRSYGVRVHDRNREANLLALHEALLTKTFRTSEYDVFKVYEPKEREIFRLPYYPDRIVHHAVMNVLEPIWTKVFTYNTYSCIKGRALDYVGYKFYREQKLIRKSIKQNFCRAAAKLNKSRRPVPVKEYKMAVASWLGWAKHSNSKHLLKSIINPQYYVSIL
ncbi:hypothetical protein [uncultured Alistipes sp.]|uniref:hypothetical protein n=1 Tax=uncultured Alistipes sp. TaxID=538949 RepID=UPI003208BC72